MQEADHILIPLLDGTNALGQVARLSETRLLLHVTEQRGTAGMQIAPISAQAIQATLRVNRTALPATQWPVIGYDALPRACATDPADLTKDDPLDPAIVEAFANALFGLYPWDGFPEPDFFTRLLRNPSTLPPKARMSADFPSPEA